MFERVKVQLTTMRLPTVYKLKNYETAYCGAGIGGGGGCIDNMACRVTRLSITQSLVGT